MKTKLLAGLGAALIAVTAFGTGYLIRGDQFHPTVYTADCHTGIGMVSCQVGDWYYGVSDTVAWRDAKGTYHDSGWPDCLPELSTVKARFAAAVVWVGDMGESRVLWVDCKPQ